MATPEEVRAWAVTLELVPSNGHLPQYVDAAAIMSLAQIFGTESEQVRAAVAEYRRTWQPHRGS